MELNLLIDTNVVVDSFLEREPFLSMSRKAISLSKKYPVKNFISASTVTDIYYITYKNLKNHQTVRALFKELFEFVSVVKVTAEDIHAAFALDWKDFEDSVQYAVAKLNNFDGIVTRNMEGFAADDQLKFLRPKKFANMLRKIWRNDDL